MDIEKRFQPGKGKKVAILGVPLGFGAGTVGSEIGTSAIRLAEFRGAKLIDHIKNLGYDVEDYGNVDIIHPNYQAKPGDNPKYLPEIIQSCQNMVTDVKKILAKGELPVILGGDHSIATGTFSGVSSHFHENNEDIGLIWFDAHADMNTPKTSPSGNTHGMPLATLLGDGNSTLVNLEGFQPKINPKYLAHIGARDLDIGEKKYIYNSGLRDNFFTMNDIDEQGMLACIKRSIEIASGAKAGYAVTFDVDVMDPHFAPGSGTLVRGGINYREAHLALEEIAQDGRMRSFEIVEVNPTLDQGNITAKLAGELVLSALGNVIL
jgi:arginase